MDLLTRDALILITAKAAQAGQMEPAGYLKRYFKEGKEREEAEAFLHLMQITYTKWEEMRAWDPEWRLDSRGKWVIKWWDED